MKGTLIAADFSITPDMRLWADVKAPLVDIDAETEKFVDYWLANGRRMADWTATWRNWMRRCLAMGGCLKPRVLRTAEEIEADYAKH
jgi:hypothetical protein